MRFCSSDYSFGFRLIDLVVNEQLVLPFLGLPLPGSKLYLCISICLSYKCFLKSLIAIFTISKLNW